jgi:regulatory subunit for Cdc7p protein kinase
MAALSILPSSQNLSVMSTSRVPLSRIPNATNSPCRAMPTTTTTKRALSQSSLQRDISYGQQPRPKKQMVEFNQSNQRTPPRQQSSLYEGRTFTERTQNTQPAAPERKRVVVRDKNTQPMHSRNESTLHDNQESIRQWQKHYRKVFPKFVFYFESIPDDVRSKCLKQILSLGAV